MQNQKLIGNFSCDISGDQFKQCVPSIAQGWKVPSDESVLINQHILLNCKITTVDIDISCIFLEQKEIFLDLYQIFLYA